MAAFLPNYSAFTNTARNVLLASNVDLASFDLEAESESLSYSLAHIATERIKELEVTYGVRDRG